jgi:hypothetical protein
VLLIRVAYSRLLRHVFASCGADGTIRIHNANEQVFVVFFVNANDQAVSFFMPMNTVFSLNAN